jgi:hypothetical protein
VAQRAARRIYIITWRYATTMGTHDVLAYLALSLNKFFFAVVRIGYPQNFRYLLLYVSAFIQ